MKDLVEAIAELSSLRDREALDFSLVKVLMRFVPAPVQAVRLLRLAGEPGDQRWQTLASLLEGESHPSRDRVWINFNTLPNLRDYPDRHACVINASVLARITSPCFTLFPTGPQESIQGVLEIQTERPLDVEGLSLIHI